MAICLNVKQVAAELNVSKSFVYAKLLNAPDFPAFRRGDRWIVPYDALKAWAAAQVEEKSAHHSGEL